MAEGRSTSFRVRALRGCLLLVTATLLPVSGLVLHASRDAHRGQGPLRHMGEHSGHSLMEIHVALGIVFAGLTLWHLASNWKPLRRYTLAGITRRLPCSLELVVSVAAVGSLIALVLLMG